MTDRRKKKVSSPDPDSRQDRCDDAEADVSTEPGSGDLRVVDSWPSTIPIGMDEVRAIEVYIGKLIDLFLQHTEAGKSGAE